MSNFLNMHIIQSIPANCCNRDDFGNIKTMRFGGTLRQRISSQCFKRATRYELEQIQDISWRTTKLPFKIFEELIKDGMSESDALGKIGIVFTGTKGKAKKNVRIKNFDKIKEGKEGTNKDQGPNKNNMVTEMLIFISKSEYERIIEICKSDSPKNLNDILKDGGKRFGASIALFGRMFADHKDIDVEAASSYAHAFTTHEIAQESDYFSALDDLNKSGEGAGHLNFASFSSGTFYRHITIDPDTLKSNLSTTEGDVIKLCCDFVTACIQAFPGGKKNSFLAKTLPSFVLIEKSNFPLSFANAFETPIKANSGFIIPSIKALDAHRNELINNKNYIVDAEVKSNSITELAKFIKENF